MKAWTWVVLGAGLGAGCGDDGGATPDAAVDAAVDAYVADADPRTTITPGPAFGIGPDVPAGRQDEDPAIAVGADGTLVALWYSNRATTPGGPLDKQIYATRSRDGHTWTAPVAVSRSTAGTDWSFAPSVAVGPNGSFIAAWWNVHLLPDGCTPMVDCTGTSNAVYLTTSADGATWTAPIEQVALGPGDWLPSVVYEPIGDRTRLYLAAVARRADATPDLAESTSRVFVTTKAAGLWSALAPVTGGVNVDGTHQSYPFVVRDPDGTYLATWTRWPTTTGGGPIDVLSSTASETMVATSVDGVAWTDVRVVSEAANTFADVFPTLHADHAGTRWWVTWVSADGAPSGRAVELPIDGSYPADRVLRTELAGYTPRALPTATPAVYWGVWVEGADPTQRVRGRYFVK